MGEIFWRYLRGDEGTAYRSVNIWMGRISRRSGNGERWRGPPFFSSGQRLKYGPVGGHHDGRIALPQLKMNTSIDPRFGPWVPLPRGIAGEPLFRGDALVIYGIIAEVSLGKLFVLVMFLDFSLPPCTCFKYISNAQLKPRWDLPPVTFTWKEKMFHKGPGACGYHIVGDVGRHPFGLYS